MGKCWRGRVAKAGTAAVLAVIAAGACFFTIPPEAKTAVASGEDRNRPSPPRPGHGGRRDVLRHRPRRSGGPVDPEKDQQARLELENRSARPLTVEVPPASARGPSWRAWGGRSGRNACARYLGRLLLHPAGKGRAADRQDGMPRRVEARAEPGDGLRSLPAARANGVHDGRGTAVRHAGRPADGPAGRAGGHVAFELRLVVAAIGRTVADPGRHARHAEVLYREADHRGQAFGGGGDAMNHPLGRFHRPRRGAGLQDTAPAKRPRMAGPTRALSPQRRCAAPTRGRRAVKPRPSLSPPPPTEKGSACAGINTACGRCSC